MPTGINPPRPERPHGHDTGKVHTDNHRKDCTHEETKRLSRA